MHRLRIRYLAPDGKLVAPETLAFGVRLEDLLENREADLVVLRRLRKGDSFLGKSPGDDTGDVRAVPEAVRAGARGARFARRSGFLG